MIAVALSNSRLSEREDQSNKQKREIIKEGNGEEAAEIKDEKGEVRVSKEAMGPEVRSPNLPQTPPLLLPVRESHEQ